MIRRVALAPLLLLLAACQPHGKAVELRFWAMGRESEVLAQLMPAFEREHHRLGDALAQIVFFEASFVLQPLLYRQLQHYSYQDIVQSLRSIPTGKLLLAVPVALLPSAAWGVCRTPAVLGSIFLPQVPHRLPAGRAPPTV